MYVVAEKLETVTKTHHINPSLSSAWWKRKRGWRLDGQLEFALYSLSDWLPWLLSDWLVPWHTGNSWALTEYRCWARVRGSGGILVCNITYVLASCVFLHSTSWSAGIKPLVLRWASSSARWGMRLKYNLIHFLLAWVSTLTLTPPLFSGREGKCVVDTQVSQQAMDWLQLNLLNFTEYFEFCEIWIQIGMDLKD